jgi:hypothetical protein
MEGDIGFDQRAPVDAMNKDQANAYDAFLRANPPPLRTSSIRSSIPFGLPGTIGNAKQVLEAGPKSRLRARFVGGGQPDISDVRGGQNTSGQDSINAVARGVGDTVSLGAL